MFDEDTLLFLRYNVVAVAISGLLRSPCCGCEKLFFVFFYTYKPFNQVCICVSGFVSGLWTFLTLDPSHARRRRRLLLQISRFISCWLYLAAGSPPSVAMRSVMQRHVFHSGRVQEKPVSRSILFLCCINTECFPPWCLGLNPLMQLRASGSPWRRRHAGRFLPFFFGSSAERPCPSGLFNNLLWGSDDHEKTRRYHSRDRKQTFIPLNPEHPGGFGRRVLFTNHQNYIYQSQTL